MVSKQVKARRLLRRDSLELGRRNTLTLDEIQDAVREERRRRSSAGVHADSHSPNPDARVDPRPHSVSPDEHSATDSDENSDHSTDNDNDATFRQTQNEQQRPVDDNHTSSAEDGESGGDDDHHDEASTPSLHDDDDDDDDNGSTALQTPLSEYEEEVQDTMVPGPGGHIPDAKEQALDSLSTHHDQDAQQQAQSPDRNSLHASGQDASDDPPQADDHMPSSPDQLTPAHTTTAGSSRHAMPAYDMDDTLHLSIAEGETQEWAALVDSGDGDGDGDDDDNQLTGGFTHSEKPMVTVLIKDNERPPFATIQRPDVTADDTLNFALTEWQNTNHDTSQVFPPCHAPTSAPLFDETLALDVAEREQHPSDDTPLTAPSQRLPSSASIPMYLDETLAFDVMEGGMSLAAYSRAPPSPYAIPQSVSNDDVKREADILCRATPPCEALSAAPTPPREASSFSLDSPGIGRASSSSPSPAEAFFQPWSPRSLRGRSAKRRVMGTRPSDSFDFNENHHQHHQYSPIEMSLSKDACSPQAGTPLMERNANILPPPTSPHMLKLRQARDAMLLASPVRWPAVRTASPEKKPAVRPSPLKRVPAAAGVPAQRTPSPGKEARGKVQVLMPLSAKGTIFNAPISSPAKSTSVEAPISSHAKSTTVEAPTLSPIKSTISKPAVSSPTKSSTARPAPQNTASKARILSPIKSTSAARATPQIVPTSSRLPKPTSGTQTTAPLSRIARPGSAASSQHRTKHEAPPTAPPTSRIAGPSTTTTRLPSMHHRPTSSTSSSSSETHTRPGARKVLPSSSFSKAQQSRLPLSGTRANKTSSSGESSDAQRDAVPAPAPSSMLKRPGAVLSRPVAPLSRPLVSPAPLAAPLPPPLPMSSPMRGPNVSPMKMLRRLQSSTASAADGERPRARRVVAGSREATHVPDDVVSDGGGGSAPLSTPGVAAPTAPPPRDLQMKPLMSMPVMPSVSRKGRRSLAATVAASTPCEADVFSDGGQYAPQEDEVASGAIRDAPAASSDAEASQTAQSNAADPPRRTSSRRPMPRSSVSVGVTSSTRLRRAAPPKEVPSVPISSAALASLTTRNSRKNEAFYARIDVRVVHIDGPRPPSPTAKIRRSSSSSSGSRADRAKKRAAEIVSHEDGGRGGAAADEYDYYSDVVERKDHRMGAGDVEPYMTPVRRHKKRSKKVDVHVHWYKNLFRGPSSSGSSVDETAIHPCKPALVQKNYGLDRHGNVRSADSPPDPAWCQVVVPVSKVIYEDDDDEEEDEHEEEA